MLGTDTDPSAVSTPTTALRPVPLLASTSGMLPPNQ